ncbi:MULTISPECIES: glycosyltransferase [unclassified Sphingomonas]|uniref:glycosyltransferase n=1 Tax=unclassified Sphingomonas TaxID=196159 RepID=UPI000ACAE613|nr:MULTISPECIES: glycosyltransferase [unclassified Sphingomonas]
MRILFIIGQVALGGIETYSLRMCRELHRRGHKLDIWFVKPGGDPALLREFERVAEVRFLSRWLPVPFLPFAPAVPADCDLVFTTGRLSLIFGALALRSPHCPPLVAGVFSQWEYSGVADDYKSRLSHQILDQIGLGNVVFCTEGCRVFHAPTLGPDIASSIVSPLLIQLPDHAPERRPARPEGTPLRIVSIGSFTPFKTYNFTLPSTIADLRASGIPVEWTIYGDGVEAPRIQQAIAQAGVGDCIHLAGKLDYARFAEVVGRADLYIGAGTTLIEASALGVPSLVALDDNPEPTTPGFFADRTGTFTSDWADDDHPIPFKDAIAAFADLSEEARQSLADRSMARAQSYSIDGAEREIQRMIANAKPSCARLGILDRVQYSLGVVREVARVAMGKGAYRVR